VNSDRSQFATHHSQFAFIIVAYLALAVYYSVTTPIFEAPDEAQHFFVVREIVEQGHLPVQRVGELARWEQEGSQPPLYYVLGAALTFWTDASDWRDFSETNPYAAQGDPQALGNKNVYLHSPRENFPWRGTSLAVHILRIVSVLCGAASIFVTYWLARTLFNNHTLALGAAALHASLPQFLFISSAVNNDALATLLCGAAVWQAVHIAKGVHTWRHYALLGLLVGLAALTKLSGAAMSVVAVWALILGAQKSRLLHAPRSTLHALAIVALVAFIVAGWWYARNWFLYGDVTGLNRMLAIVGTRNPPPDLWQLLDELEGLRLSFWGVFGWFDILLPTELYFFYDALASLALLGVCIRFSHFVSTPTTLVALVFHPATLLLLTCGVVLLGVLRWGMLTPGLQGRLLFPALSSVAVLLGAGLWQLGQLLKLPNVTWPVFALLYLSAGLIPSQVIAPAYAKPLISADRAMPTLVRFGESEPIELVTVETPSHALSVGDELPITLTWRARQILTRNYTLYIKAFGENNELIAATDTYPGFGMFQTALWQPNQLIVDRYRLRVRPATHMPVLAQVVVGFYEKDGPALPPFNREGQRIVRPVVARVKVSSAQPVTYQPRQSMDANFANQITLRGYELNTTGITLYWQAQQALNDDYTVFIHALDQAGQLIAQRDAQPRSGMYPTSAWGPHEIVKDDHALTWPPQTARIAVGLYKQPTGERLPLTSGGDAVTIARGN
jgi:4-amino-4-deoxy-L-arabinose transferase-like glycosyltransferase